MTDTLTLIATVLSIIVTALVGVLNVIAPLTKTEKDNKVLRVLRWVQDKILTLLVPAARKPSK